MQMISIKRAIKFILFLGMVAMFIGAGCAEAKRSKIILKTKINECDLSEMGKNRYFHSNHYKRNISHSTKKLHRKSSFR